MRIPGIDTVSVLDKRFLIQFETGELKYFDLDQIISKLNNLDVGVFTVEDILKAEARDGVVTFPTKPIKVQTKSGKELNYLFDLSPEFVFNESNSLEDSIGKVFKRMRELQNLSIEAVATKCSTDKSYISKFENDKIGVEWNTIRKLFFKGLLVKIDCKSIFNHHYLPSLTQPYSSSAIAWSQASSVHKLTGVKTIPLKAGQYTFGAAQTSEFDIDILIAGARVTKSVARRYRVKQY